MENFNLTEFCKRIFKQKEFFLTITVFSVLLFQSCHKIEINNSDALTLKSQTEKFFIVPENTSPITKRIAEVMQNQDKNHGYILNDFIKINGFAKWDKSLMTSGSTALNRVGTNDSLVLIPLVTDSSNKVKSSLLCVVSADSVDIRIISTSSYSVYQFTQHADSSLSAREVAMLFMMLNKSVFGYEMFQIHNTTLAHAILGDDARVDSNYISIRNDSITGEPTFLRAMIEPPAQTLASVTLYTTIHTSAPVYPGMGTMYSMGLYNLLGSIATNSGTSANISSWWLYANGQQSGSSSSTSFDEGGWITHVITPGNGNNSNVNPTQLNATVVYVVSTLGLDVEEFAWLNANVARATEIKNYLVQNNNSPTSKIIAIHHLLRMMSEPQYLSFVVSHYQTGNPNKMWWEDNFGWSPQFYNISNLSSWSSVAPFDGLCSSSFNLISGNQNSYWETNLNGLKFESGPTQINSFSAYFFFPNEITDIAMNSTIYPSPFGGSVDPKTALEYIQDFFPSLFSDGDIVKIWDAYIGKYVWRFNKFAVQEIAARFSNMASLVVRTNPLYAFNCSTPGFLPAQISFRSEAQSLLRCFIPGAVCRLTPSISSNTSNSIYSKICY